MEDPSGLLHSSIRQSYLHAAVLFSLLAVGCIIVITVIYDGITGTPLPGWVPFDLSGLPYIGALLTFAGLAGVLPLLRARAMNRFMESRLLASWRYTEGEWDLMRLDQTEQGRSIARSFLLESLIPVIMILALIVIIVVSSPNAIDPKFYEMVAIMILSILLIVVYMLTVL
ncbi:MAG: hypothetical protein LUQ42_00200, partial [Methanomicrobiales archaeon]|nr:hypothetical protein [Methanomicrobiales archaeon]